MLQKSQDSELKVVKLLTERLWKKEREINTRNGATFKWVDDLQCKSNSELQHFKGDSPQSLGDLSCNKFWCVAPIDHMKQSLQTWFVSAETLTLQVQLSRGDTGSASQTLNDGLSLYRELNQKALQGCLDHVKLCFFLLSIDAKLWANLFDPLCFKAGEAKMLLLLAGLKQRGARNKARRPKGGTAKVVVTMLILEKFLPVLWLNIFSFRISVNAPD